MTSRKYKLLVILFWVLMVAVDRMWRVAFFSLVPLLLLVPVMLAWRRRHVFVWLMGWGLLAALVTTNSLLVVGGITFLPWLVRRLLRRVSVDFSFTFFGVLGLTVGLQLLLITGWALPSRTLILLTGLLVSCVSFVALVAEQHLSPYGPA